MAILITGGAGYIGSHTAVELKKSGFDFIIADNFCNSRPEAVEGVAAIVETKPKVYRGDCADRDFLERIFSENLIEGVVHFAAFKAVQESIENPINYYANNIGSLLSVLNTCLKYKTRAFVFSSSATVYGDPDSVPIPESAARKPAASPYGNTKQIGEDILRDTVSASRGKLSAIALRYFNPIGAHPSGLIGEFPIGKPNNLVPFLTQATAGKRDQLIVFGNDYDTPDGTCIRDYIHITDLARAHTAALSSLLNAETSIDKDPYTIYNVGTGKGTSVKELIAAFKSATGVPVPHTFGPRRPGDIAKCWADPAKIERELGWRAQLSLEDALRDAWRWEQNLSTFEL